MNRAYRKTIALFLLAIFSIASTPDELIHSFAHHHDTVDRYEPNPVLSPPHIHCLALQLSLPPFSSTTDILLSFFHAFPVKLFFATGSLIPQFSQFRSTGRAPPLLS